LKTSRAEKIVGYEVHENECGNKAVELLQRGCWREHTTNRPLVLHSDKGTDEEGNHEKVKMEELGITPSYNWPRVSNHNPFSKATFRPLKYGVNWPSQGGKDLAEGRI
jgi:putative transposase